MGLGCGGSGVQGASRELEMQKLGVGMECGSGVQGARSGCGGGMGLGGFRGRAPWLVETPAKGRLLS